MKTLSLNELKVFVYCQAASLGLVSVMLPLQNSILLSGEYNTGYFYVALLMTVFVSFSLQIIRCSTSHRAWVQQGVIYTVVSLLLFLFIMNS